MKKLIFILPLAITLTFTLTSCGSKGTEKKQDGKEQKNDTAKTAQAAAYICPMHCEGSESNEPGKCKVCGMDLVKNEKK